MIKSDQRDYTGISGHSIQYDKMRKHYVSPGGDKKIGMFFRMILFFDPRAELSGEQIQKIQQFNTVLMDFLQRYRPKLFEG